MSVSSATPVIKITGMGHTHQNKLIIDEITQENLDFINSGTLGLDNYYNKITDTASSIVLDVTNFDNNLDNTVTDVQKLADAIDDIAAQNEIDGGLY